MKDFKLTIRKPDLAPPDWDELAKKLIDLLISNYGLLHEPDCCNDTLEDYLINYTNKYQARDDLKDIAVKILGNDWSSTVNYLKVLRLVGDQYNKGTSDYCPECGHPDYFYSGDYMICSQCDHHETVSDYQSNDFDEFGGIL